MPPRIICTFLLVRFNGRLDLALAAYNAGKGTVESFLTGRPLRLTGGKVIGPTANWPSLFRGSDS
jgi:soluble lytic murein transglycosylase-like protein